MSVPSHYKMFLQGMVPAVPLNNVYEADHVIRRALALFRLCFWDVANGFDLLDARLKENVGENWALSYERRNKEQIRPMIKSGQELKSQSNSSMSSNGY